MTVLKSEELQFRQGKFQLHDINIEFPEGKMTAIVGPNGSGKSTLLKLFARLLKADNGLVTLDNQPIHKYKRKEYSQKIAMLPQAKEVLPSITVKELSDMEGCLFNGLQVPYLKRIKRLLRGQ